MCDFYSQGAGQRKLNETFKRDMYAVLIWALHRNNSAFVEVITEQVCLFVSCILFWMQFSYLCLIEM